MGLLPRSGIQGLWKKMLPATPSGFGHIILTPLNRIFAYCADYGPALTGPRACIFIMTRAKCGHGGGDKRGSFGLLCMLLLTVNAIPRLN